MPRIKRPKHEDMLAILRGVRGFASVRYITLIDHVVRATIDATVLANGSMEPLAATAIRAIDRRGRVRLDQLANELGQTSEVEGRVLSEVIATLERSRDLKVSPDAEGFVVGKSVHFRPLGLRVFRQEHTVQYVPPAQFMSFNIDATSPRDMCRFMEQNDDIPHFEQCWVDVYSRAAREAAMALTFKRFYRSRNARTENPNMHRDEVLQRSQLMPVRPRVVGADVKGSEVQEGALLHRCYLYSVVSGTRATLNLSVRRYPDGEEQQHYSQYLKDTVEKDADVRETLLERAIIIDDR